MARTPRQSSRLKRLFLDNFREYGNITLGAKQAGIDRHTVYWWQEHDEQFAIAFREAELQSTEVLEAEARRRAVVGVQRLKFDRGQAVIDPDTGEAYRELEYSDTLLIFLLKARNPSKYRDNTNIELTGKDGGPIQTEDVTLNDHDRATRILAVLERARSRASRPADGEEPALGAAAGATD